MKSARSALIVSVVALSFALCACERPPPGDPNTNKPPPPGRVGPVAFDTFVQDRNAIGGKWYDYDPTSHGVTPKPQAWIVDVGDGFSGWIAFRIVSGYDPNTAELGVFTLAVSKQMTGGWTPETQLVASKNVQRDGDDCIDLTNVVEVDCASTSWHLRLSSFQYFAPSAGIAIADPGIFTRMVDGTTDFGAVTIARVDGITDLTQLPANFVPQDLPDTPPASFSSTDWDFSKLASDLPRAGMAMEAPSSEGDVWWIMTSRFSLIRTTIGSTSDSVAFNFSAVDVDRTDNSAPKDMPASVDVHVPMPAVGKATFVSFKNADLSVDADALAGKSWPYSTPKSSAWDLAIERPAQGDVRIVLSPDVAVIDATKLGLDEVSPPTDTTNTP